MSNIDPHDVMTDREEDILRSISPQKILIPIILGLGAIGWLMWRQFSGDEISTMEWTSRAWFWIGMAFAFLILRHIAYAARLRALSGNFFSWWKSIELIFIWEFSSAVSPTQLGGSVVALFMLAQEKLSAAKTATIVVYTIIVDTVFFMIGVPLLYFVYGALSVRPEAQSFADLGGWGWTLMGLTLAMGIYGTFFYYGTFVNPDQMRKLMRFVTSFKWTSRWREKAEKLGNDLIMSSQEIGRESWGFHFKIFGYTSIAWISRFLILNCLIIGFVVSTPMDLFSQGLLYGRSELMYMIMAFSPTPGASGLAEVVFGGFLSDFVPEKMSLVIAFIWRIITYYFYLIAGVIIVPNWIRKVLNRRRIMDQ